MKLSEVKEKVLAGTHCVLNDMPKYNNKCKKVLDEIKGNTLDGTDIGSRYGMDGNFLDVFFDHEYKHLPTIKVSEIDMEEEVTYTREQAAQVVKDYNSYHGWFYTKSEDEMFLNHKFPPTKKLTTEELISYYEKNEGGKVELIEKK